MKEYFNKFCIYYLNNKKKFEYKKIIKQAKREKIDYKPIEKDAKNYTDILISRLAEINHKGTLNDTREMINKYIKNKDNMTERDKKEYLELLNILCNIYNINLRNELKDYISDVPDSNTIFNELCLYYLNDLDDKIYKKIESKSKQLDFNTIDEKAAILVKNIKKVAKSFDIELTNKESVYNAINNYIDNKNNYTNKQKSDYLKLLAFSSKIYNIDLKEEIAKRYKEDNTKEENDYNLSNPLDNDIFLMSYLFQRYTSCNFNITELEIPNYYKKEKEINNNYIPTQAKLIKKIITIYLDKINNYGTEDINPSFKDTLSIEDLTLLDELKEEDISLFIEHISSNINEDITCTKLGISYNLYLFIKSMVNFTNIYEDNIGRYDNNIFNVSDEEDTINIYLGTNNKEDSFKLLAKYIIKCIENNINYNMKNNLENLNSKLRTILYSSKKDLFIKLSIIDEIALENKEMIDNLNKPIISSSTLDNSYYGLSVNNVNNLEYNDYIDQLAEVSYYRVLAKLEINKIDNKEDLDLLIDFINLEEISGESLLEANYNNHNFTTIKDIINKYITEITNTLKLYMEDKDRVLIIVEEFKKSIMYINNIYNNKPKRSKTNLAINNEDIN